MENVNCYKSVHYSICIRGNRAHPGNFQNQSVALLSVVCPGIFSSRPNWRGEKTLFRRAKERGSKCEISPRALGFHKRWKGLSVYEIWNNSTALYFLFNPLTNKHCRTWSPMINLRTESRTYQKKRILLSATQRSSNYLEPSKLNILGEYNFATLTIFYLKVLHDKVWQNS